MTKIDIKKLDHSEIEIIGEIPCELFDRNRPQAIRSLGENIELQGFRKGHVPEHVLEKHIGEHAILEEMAEITIGKEYKNIIEENKLEPIGRPEVSITKMAMGNPLEFKMKVAVVPEVVLGDYKKAAKKVFTKKETITVEEKEIDETIEEIRKMHGKHQHHENETEEEHKEVSLPEFDDVFVKTLGDFKDVADFRKKLGENILFEKERKDSDKKRMSVMEDVIADSKIDLPGIIIEAEQNKMMAQFQTDIERMGMDFKEYLKAAKKTEEDIQKEFEKEAGKRAKIQLALNKIASEEKISVDHDEIHKHVDILAKQYPEANKQHLHVYVESNLMNQKVFEFLEKQGETK